MSTLQHIDECSSKSQSQNDPEDKCNKEDQLQKKLRLAKQFLMVTGIGMSYFNLALVFGWPNPASYELRHQSINIFGDEILLPESQLDLLGSLAFAGNLPGYWLAGYFGSNLGRKRTLLYMLIPNIIGWSLVALAVNPVMILIGRFITGIYCGFVGVVGSAYCVELADIEIRGAVGAFPTLIMDFGFVICTAFGLFLHWYEIAVLGIALTIASTIIIFFLPESPTYLAVAGNDRKAKNILERLRGPNADIEVELRMLHNMNESMAMKFNFKNFSNVTTLKSMAALTVLFFVQCFCGLAVAIVNATRILIEAGSSLNENLSTFVVFTVMFISAGASCIVMDRLKRKTFLISSLSINTIVMIIMGIYMKISTPVVSIEIANANFSRPTYYKTDDLINNNLVIENEKLRNPYAWVPMVCLMVFLMSSSFGVRPIPYMLCNEYFPTAIRAQASSICMLGASSFGFLALQLYSPMQYLFTAAGIYWFYAAVSAIGIIFSFKCIRETKGKVIG